MWDLFWKSSSSTINSQVPRLVMLEMVFRPSQYSVETLLKNELASVFYLLLFLRSPSRSHPRLLMRKSPGGFRTGLVSELLSILHSSQDAIYNNAIFYLDILLVLFELCSQLMLNCLGFVELPPGPSDVGLACWVGRWGWRGKPTRAQKLKFANPKLTTCQFLEWKTT